MKNQVGPYLLQELLGRGGMGVVWRAVHISTDTPVALKVMRAEPTSTRAHTVFLNEINQASKLNHPNITAILDFAETTKEEAKHDSGLIRPNQPWIAMELARRGSLDQLDDVLTWKDLYGICQSLLSALANAHARGILHRDIKPGNILLGSPEDFRPSIKLSDFGLAMTHSEVVSPNTGLRVVGTPEYMAPEQIEGLWRDQGPWTDLYSLGCVAYELASGWPPFTGESHREVVLGHLSTPVPPLRAMSVFPESFERWLLRMLAKEPVDRFQCAADAAHALQKIDSSIDTDSPLPGPQRSSAASPTWTFMDIDLPKIRRARRPSGPSIHPEDAPDLVTDWRSLVDEQIPLPLLSASLSLVGVKKTRIVGRETERDRLWAALHEVSHSGYPRAILLRGKAGNGSPKSLTRPVWRRYCRPNTVRLLLPPMACRECLPSSCTPATCMVQRFWSEPPRCSSGLVSTISSKPKLSLESCWPLLAQSLVPLQCLWVH